MPSLGNDACLQNPFYHGASHYGLFFSSVQLHFTIDHKIFSAALALFSLGLSACGVSGKHTELVVDGEYKPFNVPSMTMEKLMELIEAEDADYIYEVFSPAVRKDVEGLYEQIQEFILFLN